MGYTTIPCAKVSELHQMPAIDAAVSQCHATTQKVTAASSPRCSSQARSWLRSAGESAWPAAGSGGTCTLAMPRSAEILDDIRADQIGCRERHALPQGNEQAVFRVERVVIRDGAAAHQ